MVTYPSPSHRPLLVPISLIHKPSIWPRLYASYKSYLTNVRMTEIYATSWFKSFDKYSRVFVGNTKKIPVEVINIFFACSGTPSLLQQRHITYKKGEIFQFNFSTPLSPSRCTLIYSLVFISINNLNMCTNYSWGWDCCIYQVFVYYFTARTHVEG